MLRSTVDRLIPFLKLSHLLDLLDDPRTTLFHRRVPDSI